MDRAKASGYNGIVFSNIWSVNSIEDLASASSDYTTRLTTIKNYASSIGLEFYPMIQTIMPAQQILNNDPNMAEVLPVKDALYVVNNGEADIVSDPAVSFPGGNFESYSNNFFSGWDQQIGTGTTISADTTVKHGGSQSMKVVTSSSGMGRIFKTISVTPYRQYHVSVWMKTQGVTNTGAIEPDVIGTVSGRTLFYAGPIMDSTQDWTVYDFTFNSLNNSQVTISFGSWGAGGTMWVDDASIEELGMTNIVRRTETPLVVKGLDGTVYTEGVDYQPVTDPLIGESGYPGFYELYHQSPSIVLTPNSRIAEGQQLRVSFYYIGVMPADPDFGFAAVSLTDPNAISLMNDEMTRLNDLLDPPGIFENYDEIRVGNWEQRDTPMTEGQLLANSIQRDKQQFKSLNSSASFFVWSDMFDPSHNAHDDYYLTNGTVDGSAQGLTSDMTVVNWNFWDPTDSLSYFSNRGIPQILAAYYDGAAPPASQWLNSAKSVNANIVGVMYATWTDNYNDLESFAQDAWGG